MNDGFHYKYTQLMVERHSEIFVLALETVINMGQKVLHVILNTWFPIPVPSGDTSYVLTVGNGQNDKGSDGWISGIAFSSNPLSHAFNSAIAYYWNVWSDNKGVTWNSDNWNSDMLGQLTNGEVVKMVVPIVPSGRDKLFYIIEHNNSWDGTMHRNISVDDVPIEQFNTNPLARSINSKMYNRFLASRIPEELTRGKNYIVVKIDMTGIGQNIYFREAGTVDMM
jgi:hypothetical protein